MEIKLTQGKMSKGGVNEKPKGKRPPTPPKQGKKDLEKLYIDAIKLIDQLEDDRERLQELEKVIKEISDMPIVKGIGTLENLYNSVIFKAIKAYEGTR